MSKPLTLATQTTFAELSDRCMDAQFDADFDERGTFLTKRLKRGDYWYYQRWQNGAPVQTYVGPKRDDAITKRVETFKDRIKPDFSQRKEMVRTLIASGLPQPDPTTGRVVEALWKAGFFRLRGILIGTTAYQCYGGVLRRRFAGAAMRTADADFAQYLAISREVKDSLPPMNEVLSAVDTTFTPIMDSLDGRHVVAFRNKDGYRVEFLTPHRGASHRASTPVRMPALGGVSAIQLPYLDFLLRDPIRSVMLHGAGVPVTVPSPARYAIHKLIVATQRMPSSSAKRGKDIAQAAELIKAIGEEHLDEDLILAWTEAWDRGPKWRVALATGRAALPGAAQESLDLSASIAVAMSGNAISPSDYGLEGPL